MAKKRKKRSKHGPSFYQLQYNLQELRRMQRHWINQSKRTDLSEAQHEPIRIEQDRVANGIRDLLKLIIEYPDDE